ncbi:MAG: nitrilase-related carbon-nitrogen hydrolase, partial [Cyanobacteria bacterium J06641_5]
MNDTPKDTVKIAIAQINPIIGDLDGNAEKILAAAVTAHADGAELLLTPELSLCGYPPRDFLLNPAFITAMAARLEQLATQLPPQIAVLVGSATPNPEAGERGQ